MKNDTISATRTTGRDELISIPRAEYETLLSAQAECSELSKKLDYLMGQLRLLKHKTFGVSSEQATEQLVGQLSLLFNEAEAWTPQGAKPVESTTVSAHTRKKHSNNLDGALPEGIAVEIVEHGIPEDERVCSACGTVMERIGKETVRTLILRPATATIREDIYYTYVCPKCKTDAAETPIRKAERLPSVIPGSFASPEAIAHIMVQKFVMASPLYRQEQEWNRAGVQLSRQTMSNWVLRVAEDWLKPVYEELHRRLLQRQVLHADETTLQVLKLEGRAARSKCYMWLYRTSGDAKSPVVLYEYRPTRKAENAAAFLESFSGWLHADGYSGYHRLPKNIRVVGCWAYLRRKFDEAVDALPKDQRAGCAAPEGLDNASSGLSRNWQGCRRKNGVNSVWPGPSR